jgi:uncharacterized protein (DUF1800 family)
MAVQTQIDMGGIIRPAGSLEADPLAPYRGPLDARRAAHLLRRAGFGASQAEVDRYAAMTVNAAVESLVRFPGTGALPAPDGIFNPLEILSQYTPRDFRALPKLQKQEINQNIHQRDVVSSYSLQVWWLNRMLATPAPLQERMALYFHGHFTSTVVQKGVSSTLIYNQNQMFRTYALGNLRSLTRAVSQDPAMQIYLDNALNVESHPNENFARELMELFTLGVGHYTEKDVQESARAWTGWQFDRFTQTVQFNPSLHDNGAKTFLGKTGNFNGDDIVDIIFEQPQCARFFATSLLSAFVYNDPEPQLVDAVAALLRKNDYELQPVISTILRSQVFYSPRAYRALVKSPVEFVVGTYKSLGLPQFDVTILQPLRQMGQVLFYPPNVAGWSGGANWLTSDMMIARQNFLTASTNSKNFGASSWLGTLPMKPKVATQTLVEAILQGDASPAAVAKLDALLSGEGSSALAALGPENYGERVSGAAYLAMAAPAFQLN